MGDPYYEPLLWFMMVFINDILATLECQGWVIWDKIYYDAPVVEEAV